MDPIPGYYVQKLIGHQTNKQTKNCKQQVEYRTSRIPWVAKRNITSDVFHS